MDDDDELDEDDRDEHDGWYETEDGSLRFEIQDITPDGDAADFLEWLELRDEDDASFDVGDSP